MEITGKFIALYVYIKKEKRLKINELAFTLREKKKKTQQKKHKESLRVDVKIRAKIYEMKQMYNRDDQQAKAR